MQIDIERNGSTFNMLVSDATTDDMEYLLSGKAEGQILSDIEAHVAAQGGAA